MNNYNGTTLIIMMAVSLCVIFTANAAPQTAKLENSATYATGETFQAFRVPTFDSTNKLNYYDVVVELAINPNGTVANTATVTSALSPNVGTVTVQPGTYQETGGTDKCTVTNLKLTNGRIQSLFRCTNGTVATFEFSVVSGAISAGHPFQSQLLAKKVNLRTDVGTQNWGIVTATTFNGFNLGGCSFGGSATIGTAIGVKTNGSIAVITVVTNDGLGVNTFCAPTINKL